MNTLEYILDLDKNRLESYEARMAELKRVKVIEDYIVSRATQIQEFIKPAIKKMKMEITKFSMSYNAENFVIGESDIHFNITFVPTGNFRFISFKGYTARGAGKNRKQLVAKSEKFDKDFMKYLKDVVRVSSNLYSFEDNATTYGSSRDVSNSILTTFSFK